MNIDIPTEEDWFSWPANAVRPMDLDENYARRRFLGKSFEEALRLFRETAVLGCSEDVSCMPPVPFRYYMLVYNAHVLSEGERERTDYDDASDGASSFLELIEDKLEVDAKTIAPIMNDLMPTVEFVGMNQEKYDADIDIYGDFLVKARRIKALWNAHLNNPLNAIWRR